MNHDDDHDDLDPDYNSGDLARRVHYMLVPTLVVDETSDVTELLLQQVLEQRAIRAWLVVLALLLVALIVVIVIVLT